MFVIHLRTVKLVVVDILISCFIDNYTNETRIMTKNKENKTIIISQYIFHLGVGVGAPMKPTPR